MDKSFGAFYNKITNLFHSNNSTPLNPSPTPELSTSLPLSSFFDRLVPSSSSSSSTATTTSSSTVTFVAPSMDPRRSPSRISRQISIKTNDNRIQIPNDVAKQHM